MESHLKILVTWDTLRGHQTRLQTKPFTLWLFNIAVENGQFIGALPIKHGGSF